jgi:hypothetical protein
VADFYELDASFTALNPYVDSIPLAVINNVGIPLGLILGPSESTEMFTTFAEDLIQHGLEQERLHSLPVLSDEGSALISYRRQYHAAHYFYFRHGLEALVSQTFVVMLARRLLFARTEAAETAILAQTPSGVAAGCHAGVITELAQRKFASLLGIVLPLSADPHDLPETAEAIFPAPAL